MTPEVKFGIGYHIGRVWDALYTDIEEDDAKVCGLCGEDPEECHHSQVNEDAGQDSQLNLNPAQEAA